MGKLLEFRPREAGDKQLDRERSDKFQKTLREHADELKQYREQLAEIAQRYSKTKSIDDMVAWNRLLSPVQGSFMRVVKEKIWERMQEIPEGHPEAEHLDDLRNSLDAAGQKIYMSKKVYEAGGALMAIDELIAKLSI